MALQSDRLVMVGLGVAGDSPPNTLQPILKDGVHLRWAVGQGLDFPWHGFYLFRRPHDPGRPSCLSTAIAKLRPPLGRQGSPSLVTPFGTVSSDAPLVLTDDFLPPGMPELDLDGRSYLEIDFPLAQPVRWAEATIGFRQDVGTKPTPICVDFRKGPAAQGPNPLVTQETTFQVYGPRQVALKNTVVRVWANKLFGLDCGQRLQVTLPCISSSVELIVTRLAGEVSIQALDASGEVVQQAAVTAKLGQTQTITLVHDGIATVVIQASLDKTALHRICCTCSGGSHPPIVLTAFSDTVPVATATATGAAKQIVKVDLASDLITSVRVSSGPAALVDLCAVPVSQNATAGWAAVPNAPEPLSLPVRHPDYPCNQGPIDLAGSTALALGRILYGPSAPWAASFPDLHDCLVQLVVGGSGVPMAQREQPLVTGTDGADPPTIPDLYLLALVLLGSLHPAIAQMLGLYWVDQSAIAGQAYDYLVVADQTGSSGTGAAAILKQIAANGFNTLDGYIAFGPTRGKAVPLAQPQDVRAYSIPGSTIAKQDGSLLDGTLAAGLRWTRETTPLGTLLPGKALMFHVWRSGLGDGVTPAAPGPYTPITAQQPVLIADPPAGLTPVWPQDSPPFRLFYTDRGLAEGWYGYEVSGVDIFGRHSPSSASAAWYQWAPVPDPQPWYYQNPPSDSVINPSAVRLLDKIPPPIPTGVEAYAIDPDDPTALRDPAYDTWFQTLSPTEKTSLVGLRVRWLWTTAHMRQAPDTAEFRIYFNPGTDPPADASEPTSWDTRYYVVPYGDHVSVGTDADGKPLRSYEVFIPAQGDAFRASVPLTPTLADPVVYANVGVSAVDDKPHTADDPKWTSGHWGGRHGNEGRVGPSAKIYRVLRSKPKAPLVPPDAARVFASPADYHSHSFYTYRWTPLANLETHVFRALDESVFATDRQRTPRATPVLNDSCFPPEWATTQKQAAIDELTALHALPASTTADAQLAAYRALSDNALRVLASLPGNEAAFSRLTIQPLDPNDSANANRLGPDNPDGYPLNTSLRAYIDSLDGRSANRYFYRAAYVDGAHNLGPLSISGPPVYLPDIVPPRTPVITKVLGGDRQITISWASNREPDLAEYRIYRAASADEARDLRLMTLVHTEVVPTGDSLLRPAEISWTDQPAPGLTPTYYRLVTVDEMGNASPATLPVEARAWDDSKPEPPTWQAATPGSQPFSIQLSWTSPQSDLRCLVERRPSDLLEYESCTGWLLRGTYQYLDLDREADLTYSYRLRVLDSNGKTNSTFSELKA